MMTNSSPEPVGAAGPAPSEPSLGNESANLDVLRSLAVMFVVVSHLPILHGSWQQVYAPSALGLLGVIIFFVHTCLVLMLSLERQACRQGWTRTTAEFLVRRGFRIYPLSVAVVLLTALLAPSLGGPVADRKTLWSNLLLIQNLTGNVSIPGPLWSLPFELQMYLLLPALFFLVWRTGRAAVRWVIAIWIGSTALIIGLWLASVEFALIRYFPCFVPGVLAYALSKTIRRTLPSFVLGASVGAVALLLPLSVAAGVSLHRTTWVLCLGLGLLIPRCRELRSCRVARAAKTLARYSYGVYLLHWMCMDVAFGRLSDRPRLLQVATFVVGLVLLPYLGYHLLEKPGIELGKKCIRRWRSRERVAVSSR